MSIMNNVEELTNQITVVDNFFTTDEMVNIKTKLQEPKWSFVGGGLDDIDQSIKSNFWHMDNLGDYFSDYLFNKIPYFNICQIAYNDVKRAIPYGEPNSPVLFSPNVQTTSAYIANVSFLDVIKNTISDSINKLKHKI